MKDLIKPMKFHTMSSQVYGYEAESMGSPDLFHTELEKVPGIPGFQASFYYDCVDSNIASCTVGCWWIVMLGTKVYNSCAS